MAPSGREFFLQAQGIQTDRYALGQKGLKSRRLNLDETTYPNNDEGEDAEDTD
jgi:hypothetical protein